MCGWALNDDIVDKKDVNDVGWKVDIKDEIVRI